MQEVPNTPRVVAAPGIPLAENESNDEGDFPGGVPEIP